MFYLGNLVKKLVLLFLLIQLVGCVRYIDSREELNAPSGFDPISDRVGIEGFFKYEQEQKFRLQKLISKRKKSVKKQDEVYRVGPGDVLELSVKDFEEVTKRYTIAPNGNIDLPFVGSINVTEKTAEEIERAVKEKIKDFLVSPIVNVNIAEYSAHVVWVIGSNNNQNRFNNTSSNASGSYPLKKRGYSLTDLLIEMGDTRIFSGSTVYLYPADEKGSISSLPGIDGGKLKLADEYQIAQPAQITPIQCDGSEFSKNNLQIRRIKACFPTAVNLSDAEMESKYHPKARIEIDVEELFGGATSSPIRVPLMPGDTVVLPPSPMVQVFGEVQRRGTYLMGSNSGGVGIGQNNIKPFLFSAIIAAQGLTYGANISKIEVFRELEFGNKAILTVDLEEVVLRGGQDLKLRDGDIIHVPSKKGRFYGDTSVNAINRLVGAARNVDDAFDLPTN